MEVFYAIMFFILGAVLASFYCVIATRLPEGKSIVKPGSHCTSCNHKLKWFELIPIISYIFLRGKCRYCHKKYHFMNSYVKSLRVLYFVYPICTLAFPIIFTYH